MKNLVEKLKSKNETISFMESCTGGFLASKITNIPSASDVLKISLVTYSNEYKIKFGVSEKTIEKYTVYSKNVAEEMAKQISNFAKSDWGVGVTGKLEIEKQNDNRVYYSIYNKNTNKYITKELTVKGASREEMKKEVLKSITNDFKW